MSTGLVLEGGAMRGMFTAGVLDVFMEADIRAAEVVGVSAGALFGVNYLSGQVGRALRYNKRYNGERDYMGLLPLLREGNIFSTEYAYNRVPRELDPFDNEAFMASQVPFFAVVTNANTGKPEYIRVRDVFAQMDVLRASGSIPFVSRAVKLGEKEYLDGGISDAIPFQWMQTRGHDKLVVVVTQDRRYRKQSVPKAVSAYSVKYPAMTRLLLDRHIRYNEQVSLLKLWERAGKAFVIRPSEPIRIASLEHDPEKLQAVYDLGRKDAENALKSLKKYLEA